MCNHACGKVRIMIDKLEKKFGRFAIRGLMKYVIGLYLAGFVIYMINDTFYDTWLTLDIDKILSGQVWRIFTFIIQPVNVNNIFGMFISLYVYFMFGTAIENVWGSFRFTLFYISGILFNILAVVTMYLIVYAVYGYGVSFPADLSYINLTLFLAFALTFPELRFGMGNGGMSMFTMIWLLAIAVDVYQAFQYGGEFLGFITLAECLVWMTILCFGPKAKHMVIVHFVLLGVEIAKAFRLSKWYGIFSIVMTAYALLNFFIHYTSMKRKGVGLRNRIQKQFMQSIKNSENRTAPSGAHPHGKVVSIYRGGDQPRHRCAVCGRTEKDDDTLEFRFCSKCNGSYEYCSDHLYTHEHKT